MVKRNEDLIEIEGDDLEFEALVRELRPDISAAEYVYFDVDIPTPEPMINEHKVDWWEMLREDYITAITTQSNVRPETQKISDDDDAEEDHDVQEKGVSFVYSLVILDRIKKCSILNDESQMIMLPTLPRKFEDFPSKNKKQESIKAYFN